MKEDCDRQKLEKVVVRGSDPTGSKSPDSNRVSILVADDELALLKVYERFLTSRGFVVHTARDGREAVTKFIETRPELIILDYRMPIEDGLEAASEMLAMKPSAKIIMLTADKTVLEEAERIGVELFLVKPISVQKLLDSIGAVISLKPSSQIVSR